MINISFVKLRNRKLPLLQDYTLKKLITIFKKINPWTVNGLTLAFQIIYEYFIVTYLLRYFPEAAFNFTHQ